MNREKRNNAFALLLVFTATAVLLFTTKRDTTERPRASYVESAVKKAAKTLRNTSASLEETPLYQSEKSSFLQEQENQQLKTLLQLKHRQQNTQTVFSAIVSFGTEFPMSSFWIDKGAKQGISEGDAVVYDEHLLGKVLKTEDHFSCVTVTYAPYFSVGATVLETGVSALAEGDTALFPQGELKLSFYTGQAAPAVGQTVVTSGIGGSLPKGYILGEITHASHIKGQISANLRPKLDVTALTAVAVITTKGGT